MVVRIPLDSRSCEVEGAGVGKVGVEDPTPWSGSE